MKILINQAVRSHQSSRSLLVAEPAQLVFRFFWIVIRYCTRVLAPRRRMELFSCRQHTLAGFQIVLTYHTQLAYPRVPLISLSLALLT
jgi:hypothetical protein